MAGGEATVTGSSLVLQGRGGDELARGWCVRFHLCTFHMQFPSGSATVEGKWLVNGWFVCVGRVVRGKKMWCMEYVGRYILPLILFIPQLSHDVVYDFHWINLLGHR
jgi:hypothetical protein